jgi:hypothetical protein
LIRLSLSFFHPLALTLPVTWVAAPLLHHTATVFSCLSELALGYLTITIAIHPVKGSAPSLALRNDTVAISIQCIETIQSLFGTLSRYLTDFIARYFAIAIRVHAHFRRITTIGHSKLVKTNGAIVVGIHLLGRIFHPLGTVTVVTMTIGHSWHRESTRDQKYH